MGNLVHQVFHHRPYLVSQVIQSVQRWVDHEHEVCQRLGLQLTHGEHAVIQSSAGAGPERSLDITDKKTQEAHKIIARHLFRIEEASYSG